MTKPTSVEEVLGRYGNECIKISLVGSYLIKQHKHSEYLDEAVSAIKELIKSKLDEVKNPYPEHIFIEPTKEEYERFNKLLFANGFSPDAFNGSMGRLVFNNCKADITKIVEGL